LFVEDRPLIIANKDVNKSMQSPIVKNVAVCRQKVRKWKESGYKLRFSRQQQAKPALHQKFSNG
jgi:hypothetical protein